MRRLITLTFSCLFFLDATYGQKEKSETPFPTLNGHKVVNLSGLRSAFNQTQLYTNLQLGNSAVYSTKGVQIGDSTLIQLTNEIVYTQLGLGYRQRIKDWVSFYIRINYGARLGGDVASLLVEGVNSISSMELGISYKISEGSKHMISGYLKTHNVSAEIIDIKGYIDDIIANKPLAAIKNKVPALNIGGGIAGSYVPFKFLGINFDGQLSYGETLQRDVAELMFATGVNVDIMFNDWINAPLSLVLGGHVSNIPSIFSINSNVTSTFQFKLAYNKSDDFIISIESYKGKTPITDTTRRVGLNGVVLNSVFYF